MVLKSLIAMVTCSLFLTLSAQDKPIDFRSTDAKGLTRGQMLEYIKSRNAFFSDLRKSAGSKAEKKSLVIKGNKIKTIIYNTGSISDPTASSFKLDVIWNGLGYGYEFGPLVGAKVQEAGKPATDSIKIVSEGFDSPSDGEYGLDGTKYGWLPKAGFSAPFPNTEIASWGARAKVKNDLRQHPPSWPDSWFEPNKGIWVYPSFLGGNSTVPDEEVYYVVDDFTKKDRNYYPFPSDSTKRGLGLDLEVRTIQFSNPLAEDIIFLVYTAQNVSPKDLPTTYFGMFGDPHIGGSPNDDAALFVPAREGTVFKDGTDLTFKQNTTIRIPQRSRNLVYAWDPDNANNNPLLPPGYFGYKFLESPTNSGDGVDNDEDGIIDESPFNGKGVFLDGVAINTGISDVGRYTSLFGAPKARWSGDEDGDWDVTKDDVGVDGDPESFDLGEGDGEPSAEIGVEGTLPKSEPHFGFRDVNESDQIGLKSFWALKWGATPNRPKSDDDMYNRLSSDTSDVLLLFPETGDNVFLYGSGPFKLNQFDKQRFSIALMMGLNLDDLLLNSDVAQRVLEANYAFAQPPPKPIIRAVPGDGRVTLYWDRSSELGTDPLTNRNDFEGYKIYRSEDYNFTDVFTITDGSGNPYLGSPLKDGSGQKAVWHLPWHDTLKALYVNGFHPAEISGRNIKYYMGEPDDMSGLRHYYVDSTVTNGKTYFYAVVAFDHGVYDKGKLELSPTETQAKIDRDSKTQEFVFDVNTASAVPNKLAVNTVNANTPFSEATLNSRKSGEATGKLSLKVIDELKLKNSAYTFTFDTAASKTYFNIFRSLPEIEQVTLRGVDTNYINLVNRYISVSSFKLFKGSDTLNPMALNHIVIDSVKGRFKADTSGILKQNQPYTVVYNYYPIAGSPYIKNEDANPVFDGVRPYVIDDSLKIRSNGFIVPLDSVFSNLTFNYKGTPNSSVVKQLLPRDVTITWVNSLSDTNASGQYNGTPDSARLIIAGGGFTYVKLPFKASILNDTSKLVLLVYSENTGKFNKRGRWDPGEDLYLSHPGSVFPPPAGKKLLVHDIVVFTRIVDTVKAVIPGGTMFRINTLKPFGVKDRFTFDVKSVSYDTRSTSDPLGNVYVVPNPYVITSQFEQPNSNDNLLRGDRALQFRNLPKECTIRIYTVTGELVQTLHKSDETSYKSWDLLSSESARIGYGVYIFHVETPGGKSKIGRFGVIK